MTQSIQLRSSAELTSYSLKELHQQLQHRGLTISYTALSDLIRAGDIAQQLQVGGGGNRRQFRPEVLDILIEFIPWFQGLPNITDGAAPDALRHFLTRGSSNLPATPSPSMPVPQIGQTADPFALAAAAGHAQGLAMADRVYGAADAAEFLCCSVLLLRRTVKPSFRLGKSREGDRWYRRDLLSLSDPANRRTR